MKELIIMAITALFIAFIYFNAGQKASYPTDWTCFRQHVDWNMTDNSWNVIIVYRDWDILCTRFTSKHNAEYYIAK